MQVSTILLRMPNWLGDCVMTSCAIQKLRVTYPDARFILVGSKACEIYKADSLTCIIDESKTYPKTQRWHFKKQLVGLGVIAKIKAYILYSLKFWQRNRIYATYLLAKSIGKADLSFSFNNSFFGALFLCFTGSKIRVGFAKNARSALLTHALKLQDSHSMHQVQKYEFLIQDFIEPGLFAHILPLKLPQSTQSLLIDDKQHKHIGINPGAAFGSAKCWQKEYFIAVIEAFLDQGHYVYLFGTDSNLSWQITQGLRHMSITQQKNFINLTNKTNLTQLVDSIAALHLFITNDSGPMHIAAASSTPMISIFGPTDTSETCPWNEKIAKHYFCSHRESISKQSLVVESNIAILCKHLSCAPCKKRTCPLVHHNCMKEITPQEVLLIADSMLVS
ncbi:MAG: glycosyltransferase family 9 protein [Helicobacter sp.]|uniref:glycosyltransferase family 9 protein n=1 Tax=Helicobacter sp. 10-6591 TaxID=2004998 RepID=UPI000DCBA05F|nr:glycosyltransferase family 9 protein [Helicobacter sp. 10-6591]MCI6217189.1 glycosyltransferase family 9 protein [Helicobacter sp.]MCI7485791.1 glycosyltransferase family 9 protein [Helicobacter sp.]MDD7567228.1 glycosyltransferase family 9 protein [Helicobacter sp.]MDY5740669.1 glycosyltransferase family 9 protein [Helicobacter sp.]RAX52430.1 hypothetical protein CCY97_07705 [Helicobacter sp. 10-6591]